MRLVGHRVVGPLDNDIRIADTGDRQVRFGVDEVAGCGVSDHRVVNECFVAQITTITAAADRTVQAQVPGQVAAHIKGRSRRENGDVAVRIHRHHLPGADLPQRYRYGGFVHVPAYRGHIHALPIEDQRYEGNRNIVGYRSAEVTEAIAHEAVYAVDDRRHPVHRRRRFLTVVDETDGVKANP